MRVPAAIQFGLLITLCCLLQTCSRPVWAQAQPDFLFHMDEPPGTMFHLDNSGQIPVRVMWCDPTNGPGCPSAGVLGHANLAMHCGGNDGAEIDNVPMQSESSVVAWVRPLSVGGTILHKWQAPSWDATDALYFDLQGRASVYVRDNDHMTSHVATAADASPLGVWTCLGAVIDDAANTATLYVDGAQAASVTYHAPRTWFDYWAFCHSTPQSVAGYFTGDVDEVRIYNMALTGDDVRRACGMPQPTAAPLPQATPTPGCRDQLNDWIGRCLP